MMKVILPVCVLCIILAFLCCSCGLFGDQRYFCDINEVESVQIVRLDKLIEGEYRYDYTILSQISDTASFVERLNKLKHSVNWGDPRPIYVQYVVIKIDYRNGDFDLVHPDVQCIHRSGVNYDGNFFFDEEQFDALISDYIGENGEATEYIGA